jgi:hypothetical protein
LAFIFGGLAEITIFFPLHVEDNSSLDACQIGGRFRFCRQQPMRLKQLLKLLNDSERVIAKLGEVAIKAYALAQLAHTLFKIAVHR